MPHKVARFAFVKKALTKYLKRAIRMFEDHCSIGTNPSINADIASVSRGVMVTVRSDAGKMPPYLRTTKGREEGFRLKIDQRFSPATTIETMIMGMKELINQEMKLIVEFKPIIFIV